MSPQTTKKIVHFLVVAALAVSMIDYGVSGSASVLDRAEPKDVAKVEEITTDIFGYPTAPEASEPKCDCDKSKPEIPEALQGLGEKDLASSKAKKSTGKKFRVITISIPVEADGSESAVVDTVVNEIQEETVGCRKGKKLEAPVGSGTAIPLAVDVKGSGEAKEVVIPESSDKMEPIDEEEEEKEVEKVAEVPRPKKPVTPPKQSKSEKKRSKRSTKGKSHKNKEFSKVKGEKKGKNKK